MKNEKMESNYRLTNDQISDGKRKHALAML